MSDTKEKDPLSAERMLELAGVFEFRPPIFIAGSEREARALSDYILRRAWALHALHPKYLSRHLITDITA